MLDIREIYVTLVRVFRNGDYKNVYWAVMLDIREIYVTLVRECSEMVIRNMCIGL